MLRGHRSVYLSLLTEDTTVKPREGRGRSETLIKKRNEYLVCRYFYYAKVRRLQYFDALELLEQDVFICQRTIQNILQDNNDILKELSKLKPKIKYFKERFPNSVWLNTSIS